MTWQPVPDSEVTRGLTAMIIFNGLHEFADCRLCRQVPDQASVPSEVLEAMRELAKDALHRTTPYTRSFGRGKEGATVQAWLDTLKGEATDVK